MVRGRQHRYNPDILVEYHDGRVFLEEVKGRVFNRIVFGTKNLAALIYCSTRNMKYRVIFQEQLEVVY